MSQNPTAPRNPMSKPATAAPSPDGPGPRPSTPFGRPGGDDDFVINLDGADLSSKMIPAGDYYAYVSELTKETSKAGNPMVVWSVTIWGGEQEGKTMKSYTALTPDALWKFAENCAAVNYPMPEDKRIKFGDLKKAALRTIVTIRVVDSEYNNRPSTSLDSLFPYSDEPGKKLPSAGVPQQ